MHGCRAGTPHNPRPSRLVLLRSFHTPIFGFTFSQLSLSISQLKRRPPRLVCVMVCMGACRAGVGDLVCFVCMRACGTQVFQLGDDRNRNGRQRRKRSGIRSLSCKRLRKHPRMFLHAVSPFVSRLL